MTTRPAPTHNQKIHHQLAHEALGGPYGHYEREELLETLRVTWHRGCARCTPEVVARAREILAEGTSSAPQGGGDWVTDTDGQLDDGYGDPL